MGLGIGSVRLLKLFPGSIGLNREALRWLAYKLNEFNLLLWVRGGQRGGWDQGEIRRASSSRQSSRGGQQPTLVTSLALKHPPSPFSIFNGKEQKKWGLLELDNAIL